MGGDTVQFINNLSGSGDNAGPAAELHTHEPGGALHSHGGPGEHGHTHEHLENAGNLSNHGLILTPNR